MTHWLARHLSRLLALTAAGALACGCSLLEAPVVRVAPDPAEFGHSYPESFADAGEKIAREQCASCHAIGQGARSPVDKAPPFNTLLSRYDASALTTRLSSGISIDHARMPKFDFNIIAANSLVAYLETLKP